MGLLSRGLEPCPPWGANIQVGGGIVIKEGGTDTLVLSKVRLPYWKWPKVGCRATI